MCANVQCTPLKLGFFQANWKNLIAVTYTFMCAGAQFNYANINFHYLHDSVVKGLGIITYIEPKMKEVSEGLTE